MSELTHVFEEVKLVYRNKTKAEDRPPVRCAKDAYDILLKSWDLGQINLLEECKILLLDRRLRLMSIASISKGGMSKALVDPKIVFSIALKRRASSFILAHNHPSGNLQPSQADIKLTELFILSGKTLELPMDDHLIISEDGHLSIMNEDYIHRELL
ncbi:MAG: DNA repair protein [Cyclobacteriaceae bacterium]